MQPKYLACGLLALAFITACKDTDRGTLRRWRDLDSGAQESSDAATDAAEGDAAVEASIQRLVGTVDDSDIRVAAVIENRERGRVFFCGGPTSYATSTKWVSVALAADGGFDFDADGWTVSGKLTAAALSGTVQQNDQSRRFSALKVAPGTIAGLYDGTSDCGRVGLIVAQPDEGSDPKGQGACVGEGHPPEQVSPFLPVALKDGAISVKIGDIEAAVHEAAPF
jgi:hypothetical protein